MSVPLGSIFKLPAESWEEIEASEGKTNLLDSTRSENSILARSDVKTKGQHKKYFMDICLRANERPFLNQPSF